MKVDDVVKSYDELKKAVTASPAAKSYINNVNESGRIAVHFSKNMRVDSYTIVNNKTNRMPTNTPEFIHDYIDTVYEYQYGIPYRSEALFTYVRDINNTASGLYYVIPVGDSLDMMYVNGITDFYLQLLQDLDEIADAVVSNLGVDDMEHVYVSKLTDVIADNIEQVEEEDTRQRIVLANRDFLPQSIQKKILSDDFVNLVKKEMLNHVDKMIKGNVIDDVNLGDISKEELHIHSERFVLINSTWAETVAKEKGIDVQSLFKSMI